MAGRGFVIAAVGAGLLLLSACEWTMARNTDSDESAVGERITSVRLANDAGDVTIRVGDTTMVRRTVHYDRDRPGGTHRVDKDVLVIDACPVRDCWIDYDVTVPAGTTVQGAVESGRLDVDGVASVNLKASSGNVTVRHVTGPVNVDSSSGNVEVSDVGGATAIKAQSGNVSVDDARAAVALQAESGQITARLSSPQNVRVQAASGNVEVTVPSGKYRVTTAADSGHVDSDVTDDASATHQLDLRTESGNITVRNA
jgi:hypothetical protein